MGLVISGELVLEHAYTHTHTHTLTFCLSHTPLARLGSYTNHSRVRNTQMLGQRLTI